jgi:hypothetical protein
LIDRWIDRGLCDIGIAGRLLGGLCDSSIAGRLLGGLGLDILWFSNNRFVGSCDYFAFISIEFNVFAFSTFYVILMSIISVLWVITKGLLLVIMFIRIICLK